MPVSLEQWRASVGSLNASRSHSLRRKYGGKRAPKTLWDQLLSLLLALVVQWTGLATTDKGSIASHMAILQYSLAQREPPYT